jgi:hypothetical protein
MDLMCPFYDWQHVDICLDTLVSCITTKARKFSSLLRLALGNKATKKGFGCHRFGNQKFSIAITVPTKKFLSPKLWAYGHWNYLVTILRATKYFPNHHLMWPSNHFSHKLCWVTKIGTCIPNSLSLLKCVGFVLFNKQWLPYTLGGRGETFKGIWSFKHHIPFAISVNVKGNIIL